MAFQIIPSNRLHEACQRGKTKRVRELMSDPEVEAFINVSAGVFGYTPLHEATSSRKPEIIELLLENGAIVDAFSNGRYTPLHIAASIGDIRCIEVLLKYNANVKIVDEFGKTPHRTAELNRQKRVARVLKTAEIKNAVKNNREFAKLIENIQEGEDVTFTCFNECLDIAVEKNYHFAAGFLVLREPDNLMECLKKAFAKPDSKETATMLLMCIASRKGDVELLELLCGIARNVKQPDSATGVVLKRDYLPDKALTAEKLEIFKEAVKDIDHAFPVSLACVKQKHKATKTLLFNLYCSPTKKDADWHGLALSYLEDDYITDIASYQRLYLGWNELTQLPSNMQCLQKLVRLDLQRNHLKDVPACLFTLPVLRNLNLSFNALKRIPSVDFWSPALNILDLQGNFLNRFPDCTEGAALQFLNLADNKLHCVPLSICNITTLTSLDISENRDIRELPVQLGNLSKLLDLNFRGIIIRDPPVNLQKPTKALISYLRARLRAAEPFYCMKLLIIGLANHGKSTLLQRLQGNTNFNLNVATQGIDIQEIKLKKSTGVPGFIPLPSFTFRVWDFAGQEEYYATHQCFLSHRSLYLLIWDATRREKGVDDLRPWLDNLASRVPGATVLVIGTKIDLLPPNLHQFEEHMRAYINKLYTSKQQYGKIILAGIEFVSSNTKYKEYSSMMDALKTKIYNVAENMTNIDDQGRRTDIKIMGEQVPQNYKMLERELHERQKEKLAKKQIPILSRNEFLIIARNLSGAKDPLQEEEIPIVTRFLHNIGTILHYNDPNQDLKDMYFISPSWLCHLLAKIITVDAVHTRIQNGVLSISDLKNFIIGMSSDFPVNFYEKYLRLLYRFQIACQIDAHRVLVPSKLPAAPSKKFKENHDSNILIRQHVFSCIPFGFWERFISRLLLFMKEMLVPSAEEDDTGNYRVYDEEEPEFEPAENESESGDSDDDVADEGSDLSINQANKTGVVYINADVNVSNHGDNASPFFQRLVSLNGIQLDTNSTTSAVSTLNSDVSSTVPSIGSMHFVSGSSTSYDEASLPSSETETAQSGYRSLNNGDIKEQSCSPRLVKSLMMESTTTLEASTEDITRSLSVIPVNQEPAAVSLTDQPSNDQSVASCEATHVDGPLRQDQEQQQPDNAIGEDGTDAVIRRDQSDSSMEPIASVEAGVLPSSSSLGYTSRILPLGEENIFAQDVNIELCSIIGRSVVTSPSMNYRSASSDEEDNEPNGEDEWADQERDSGHEEEQVDVDIPKRAAEYIESTKSSKEIAFQEYFDIARLLDDEILSCWKDGVVFKHPRLFFSVQKIKSRDTDRIETKVSNTSIGRRVLGFIIDHVRTLIKEWYPGLAGNDGENPYVSQYAACPICTRMRIKPPFMFNVQDAFANIYISKNGDNCLPCGRSHCPQVVDIEALCPELLFKDLTKDLQIDRKKLEFEEHDDYFLGKGAFGNVYRGNYIQSDGSGMPVAIKIYNFEDHTLSAQDAFHDIRQEIFILSKLRDHTFIVRFIGFVIEPRLCALMELASYGNLKDALYDEKSKVFVERFVFFRITKQIAAALNFMHQRRIIHRDIKSDNILVFSLDHDADVNVKVTDFGTANFLAPIGMRVVAGTYGFMAPEMFDYASSDEYTTKVDIYSFAMVIYEMLTERRPFHDLQFPYQIPEALKRGERPSYKDVQQAFFGLYPLKELMIQMWQQESTKRPTALQVLQQVQHPSFQLLYGKRVLEVPQNPRIMCPVQSTYEVWVICDDKKGSFITILDMKTSEVKQTLTVDGSTYGVQNYNLVNICLIDDQHIAIVVLSYDNDLILIFSTEKQNIVCHEEIVGNIKSICVHDDQVYIGFQSGRLSRVSRKNLLKGKLQKESIDIIVKPDRPIHLLTFDEQSVYAAIEGDLHQYPLNFTKDQTHGTRIRLHQHRRIKQMIRLPTESSSVYIVFYEGIAQVHFMRADNFELIQKIDLNQLIRKYNPCCESCDRRVTNMSVVNDVLWIGTGSGHIFLYDIGKFESQVELLTAIQPYQMELRKLSSWRVDNRFDKHGVQHLMLSTGRALNPEVFDQSGLIKIGNSSSPDDLITPLRRSPISVTSFDSELRDPLGKVILIWHAADAKLIRNMLAEY